MARWSRCLAGAFATLLIAAPAAPAAAQAPSLRVVLERAGAYVADLQRELARIVAEEHYTQAVWDGAPSGPATPRQRVELRSDFLLVRPAGTDRYVELRDTFEVDGQPVHDRRGRLAGLLSQGAASPSIVQRIVAESARYNIGDVERTLNVPTFPLIVLHPRHQWRFRFRRTNDDGATGPSLADEPGRGETAATFRASTEVWVVSFQEVERPTLVRTPDGRRNRPVRGRLWIEPASGQLRLSELTAGDDDLRATISVSYQSPPLLGFLVPIEMRERYDAHARGTRIEGTATYTAFRPLEQASAAPAK